MGHLTQQPDPDHTGFEECPLCGHKLRPTEEDRRNRPTLNTLCVKIMEHDGYFDLWLCPFFKGTWERKLWN